MPVPNISEFLVNDWRFGWSVALSLEGVLTLLGNAVTVGVFLKGRIAPKKASCLLINLAIADLLVGVGAIALGACRLAQFQSFHIYLALDFFIFLFAAASVCSLAVIAVERAFAITKPLKHRAAPTSLYRKAIGLVWVVATVVVVLLALFYAGIDDMRFVVNALCIVFILTISLSYFAIWRSSSQRPIERAHAHAHARAQERNKNLTINLAILTFLSLVTWLPTQVLSMLPVESVLRSRGAVYQPFINVQVVSSLINPFVYALRMPEFRRETKRSFIGCRQSGTVAIPMGIVSRQVHFEIPHGT